MLSISVSLPFDRLTTLINQTRLQQQHPWRKKHLKSIETNYRKAEHFDALYAFLEPLISMPSENLSELNINIIRSIAERLGIQTKTYVASELEGVHGESDERLASICRQLGCDVYLSPIGAAEYIEKSSPGGAFLSDGISLYYQQFEHPVYQQLYGEFVSHLSVIDLLFNLGFAASAEIIRSSRRPRIDCLSYRRTIEN